jgi:hypothetical protein
MYTLPPPKKNAIRKAPAARTAEEHEEVTYIYIHIYVYIYQVEEAVAEEEVG